MLLAAAHLGRESIGHVRFQVDHFQQSARLLRELRARAAAMDAHRLGHADSNLEARVERARRVLKDHPHLLAGRTQIRALERGQAQRCPLGGLQHDLAGARHQAQDGPAQTGLARSGLAHQGQGATYRNRQRDLVHRGRPAAHAAEPIALSRISHAQGLDSQDRGRRVRSLLLRALRAGRLGDSGTRHACSPGQRIEQSLGSLRLRSTQHLFDLAVFDDLALVHDDDALADLGNHAQIVRDPEQGESALGTNARHQVKNRSLHGDIQRSGGLIGKQQLRLRGERDCDHDALALPAAELVRETIHQALWIGQLDLAEERQHPLFPFRAVRSADAVSSQHLFDLESDPEDRIQGGGRILEDQTDSSAAHLTPSARAQPLEALACEVHRSAALLHTFREQSKERQSRHGLAAARRPDHAQTLTGRKAETDPADQFGSAGADAQISDGEQGFVVHHEILARCPAILSSVTLRVLALLLALLPLACREAPHGLVVANGDDVSLLHPQRTASISDVRVLQALHTGLTRLDPRSLHPEPGLAERFEASESSRVWTFWLRRGLRWSDGTPFGAQDIARSWQQFVDPSFGAPYASWLHGAEVEVIAATSDEGGGAIRVRFPDPQPAFAEMCAFPALAPVPAHAPAERVGAGPYRLVSRKVRDRIVVERNPFYWDAARVTIPAIDFLTVESQVTALNLFLAGDVAYAPNAPELAVAALREQRPESFAPAPQLATTFLRFQVTEPPFDSLALRRAFAAAIDPEALGVALGQVRTPAWQFVPPNTPGWVPAPIPSWRRNALPLPEPPDGRVEYLYNSSELNRSVAEILQAQWRESLDLEVALTNQEWKSFLAAQRGLEYQISRSSWIGDYLDPIAFLEIFTGESGNNRTGWQDDMYDGLIEQARGEADPEARRLLLREAERRLLDQAIIVPLYHEVSLELIDPRLEGLHRNLRGYIDWGRLRWTEEVEG